jgi:hypothetical protein
MRQGKQCIAILNKTSLFFFFYKNEEQEGITGYLWWGWYQWEGGGCEERV